MVRDRDPKPPRQGKMDKYTKPITTVTTEEEEATSLPDNAALLAAIHSSRETLEGKIGEVRSEVSLLRQDLRKVTELQTQKQESQVWRTPSQH